MLFVVYFHHHHNYSYYYYYNIITTTFSYPNIKFQSMIYTVSLGFCLYIMGASFYKYIHKTSKLLFV